MRAVPTYDYECRSCGNRIEVIHSMVEDGPSTCEVCGGALKRVIYPTGIIFKGSGFYKTDSRNSGASSGSGAKSSKAAGSADTASGDSGGKPAEATASTSSDGNGSGSGQPGSKPGTKGGTSEKSGSGAA